MQAMAPYGMYRQCTTPTTYLQIPNDFQLWQGDATLNPLTAGAAYIRVFILY